MLICRIYIIIIVFTVFLFIDVRHNKSKPYKNALIVMQKRITTSCGCHHTFGRDIFFKTLKWRAKVSNALIKSA